VSDAYEAAVMSVLDAMRRLLYQGSCLLWWLCVCATQFVAMCSGIAAVPELEAAAAAEALECPKYPS